VNVDVSLSVVFVETLFVLFVFVSKPKGKKIEKKIKKKKK